MEEVVALRNYKLSALQESSSDMRRKIQVMEEVVVALLLSSILFSPIVMPPVVSQASYTTPPTISIKVRL